MSDERPGGLPPAETADNSVQNALLVGGGLALLLALAAFLGLEILSGPPEMEIIDVSIDSNCVSKIAPRVTARQSDRDILVWRVENECTSEQNVLMCVTPDGAAPPLRCWGDPEKALLDTPFSIDASKGEVTSYIICALKWPPPTDAYKYDVEFLTGDATKILICPQDKQYELALEVVP